MIQPNDVTEELAVLGLGAFGEWRLAAVFDFQSLRFSSRPIDRQTGPAIAQVGICLDDRLAVDFIIKEDLDIDVGNVHLLATSGFDRDAQAEAGASGFWFVDTSDLPKPESRIRL